MCDCVSSLPERWERRKVEYTNRSGKREAMWEVLDKSNNKFYRHEPILETALKCLKLAVVIPIYTIGYIALNTARIFTRTGYTFLGGLAEKIFFKSGKSMAAIGQATLNTLAETVNAVARAPFYALKMWGGAFIGILFPLHGRRIIADAEAALHSNTPRQHDFRVIADKSILFKDVLFGDKTTFYAAYCMQPYGSSGANAEVKDYPLSEA